MRDGESLEHRPAQLGNRLELEEQPRLSDSSLGYCGDNLSATSLGLLGGVLHRVDLSLAPDELGQTAPNRPLQSRAQRTQAGNFINVDRLADAFNARRPHRLQCEVAFNQLAQSLANRD